MGTLKNYSKFVVGAFALVILAGCSSPSGKERAPTNVKASMATQSQILPELILLTQDDKLASSDEKKQKLRGLTSQLVTISHEVGKNSSGDPILKFVARDFGQDLDAALVKMEKQDWDAARKSLSNITHYCVSCHTLQKGSANKNLVNSDYLKSMSSVQKADYYAALLQFDDAVVNFEEALSDPTFAKNEHLWMESLQKMLAITVRVKASPGLTLELISRFTYPKKMKESVAQWRAQAKAWRDERQAPPDLLGHVRDLYAKAENIEKKFKAPSGFIHYLRISSMLHTFLNEARNNQNQEALYLSGLTANALAVSHSAVSGGRQPASVNYWSFPEDYFKACMTVNEGTDWGQKCSDELKKITK